MTRHSSPAWLTRVIILISASSLLAAGLVLALTQRPRLTQTSQDSETKQGSEIRVARDGGLQEALNRAEPGDVIVLESGSVYRGPIRLPRKAGNSYITIQSSRAGELAAGVRVGPGQSGLFAKLQSTLNGQIVVTTEPGAHHYRFVGIEFSAAQAGLLSYDLVRFGDNRQAQTTLASVPHHLVIDRCYIHGFATQEVQRGITLNSAETSVINSYISDIHGQGYDTQALAGWNGPGPFHIVNNYLEAAGENIMFGGADPGIANLVPSDIEIRGNYFFKPLSWKVGDPSYGGLHWSVKNLLELKNARNVVIDGNVLENNWVDAQNGTGVLFTVRNQEGTAPWSIIENVTFSNNVVKNSPAALNLLGSDYNYPSQRSTGLTISNNLFTSINGTFLTMQGFYNVTLDHNTHFQSGNIMTLYGEQSLGFIYRNNLTIRANTGYGVKGDATGEGTIALQTFTPGFSFLNNVLMGAEASQYPRTSFFPKTLSELGVVSPEEGNFRLSDKSRYKRAGTNGKDIGVDFDRLPLVR